MAAPDIIEESSVDAEIEKFLDYNYWAPAVYTIRDKRNQLVSLTPNLIQNKIGEIEKEELRKHGEVRVLVLKARQGGVTTDQQARSLHTIWSVPGANTLTLAHSREDTDKIFQITRRAVENFPKDLLPKTGKSSAREVRFTELDTSFWTGTAGSTRVGRGVTITRLHGSEFAFWPKPKQTLGTVEPSLIPIGSVVILETTPDAYESEAHLFWREAKAGENGYRAVFFPWWECDPVFYRLPLASPDELGDLSKEELFLVQKYGLDLEQIKWRRRKIKQFGRSTFLREYPEDDETCWMIAGEKFFDSDILQELLPRASTPKATDLSKRVKVFDSQTVQTKIGKITEQVIIGCDTSEGTGLDGSDWVARSWPSWRLLAQFSDRDVEPKELADILFLWGKFYQGALLVVEKNFHGITVLRRLRDDLKYPLGRIFHRTTFLQNADQVTDYIGWATSGESLPLMLDYGREILRASHEGTIHVPSRKSLIDFAAVPRTGPTSGRLTGKDGAVSEILAWAGREFLVRSNITVLPPLYW